MRYSSSERFGTGVVRNGGNYFVKMQARVLRGCNIMLSTVGSDGEVSRTRIDFLKSVFKRIGHGAYKSWAK